MPPVTPAAPVAPTAHIAILAKAPQPGLAKTRLIPALGATGAARLQRALTRHTLHTAQAAALGPVALWCAPGAGHRFFRALQRGGGPALHAQPAGDLGARMHAAAQALLQPGGPPLLIVGTDCPALTAAHLRAAAQVLHDGADAVCLPAEDGGYVLIGLRAPQPALFEAMTWSTDRVMADTRQRAQAAGLRLHEGPVLWDVDRPTDLQGLRALRPAPGVAWGAAVDRLTAGPPP